MLNFRVIWPAPSQLIQTANFRRAGTVRNKGVDKALPHEGDSRSKGRVGRAAFIIAQPGACRRVLTVASYLPTAVPASTMCCRLHAANTDLVATQLALCLPRAQSEASRQHGRCKTTKQKSLIDRSAHPLAGSSATNQFSGKCQLTLRQPAGEFVLFLFNRSPGKASRCKATTRRL